MINLSTVDINVAVMRVAVTIKQWVTEYSISQGLGRKYNSLRWFQLSGSQLWLYYLQSS
jgi:hypothetical protein